MCPIAGLFALKIINYFIYPIHFPWLYQYGPFLVPLLGPELIHWAPHWIALIPPNYQNVPEMICLLVHGKHLVVGPPTSATFLFILLALWASLVCVHGFVPGQ